MNKYLILYCKKISLLFSFVFLGFSLLVIFQACEEDTPIYYYPRDIWEGECIDMTPSKKLGDVDRKRIQRNYIFDRNDRFGDKTLGVAVHQYEYSNGDQSDYDLQDCSDAAPVISLWSVKFYQFTKGDIISQEPFIRKMNMISYEDFCWDPNNPNPKNSYPNNECRIKFTILPLSKSTVDYFNKINFAKQVAWQLESARELSMKEFGIPTDSLYSIYSLSPDLQTMSFGMESDGYDGLSEEKRFQVLSPEKYHRSTGPSSHKEKKRTYENI